jgi:Kdo2-lipid IVA lauroyltransferase/acyltransferase
VRRRSDYPLYLAARAVVAGAQTLPRRAALAIGATLGGVARSPLGLRRAVADDNLAIAFPERSAAERDAICRRMYAHWGRMTFESLRAAATDGREVFPLIRGGGEVLRTLRDFQAKGRGVLVLSGHIGNWESAAAYVATHGLPVTAVWKPQANPYIAAYLDRLRVRLGIDAIPMPEAREGVIAALRAGRIVGLVADQAPIRGGTWVPFFGRPTKTFNGPGYMAAQAGAPVLFGGMLADGAGGYRMFLELLEEEPHGAADDVVVHIATRYRARLEALVRTAPEQYLWTHRLWKESPPETAVPRPGGGLPSPRAPG